MGKTNTNTAAKNTAPATAFEFRGKTATELREALDSGVVTKTAVIAFLKQREADGNLRAPSKKLLNDLTGAAKTTKTEAKPKAETPKTETKTATASPTPDMSVIGLLARRLDAVEAEVASLKAALAALTEAEDDTDMDDEDMDDDTDADEDDGDEDGEPMTVEEARDAMADMNLTALRDACRRAGFEPPKGGKAALVDALVQHGIESGMVAAPVEVKVEVKPEPKAEPKVEVKPAKASKPTPASVAASIDLGSDLF
jgi:hypothetical protein